MATIQAFGDWTRLGGILRKGASATQWQQASDKAVLREAHRLRRLMVRSFNRGGPESAPWPPLAEITLKMRAATGFKGRKPMMRTGDLRNSCTVVEEDEGVFVGFHREVAVRGKPSSALMEIHEFGMMIAMNVTDSMRRFWLAMSIKSGGDIQPLSPSTTVIVIEIPPRPVVGPIMEEEKENIGKNIVKSTLRGIGWGEFAALIG